MRKVLIVDDCKHDRELMSRVLKKLPAEVLFADTAGEAQRISKENLKDLCLVVSDLRLPCMPGVELLGWFRERYPFVPLVAVSGYHDEIEEALLRDIGVIFVWEKPLTSLKLNAVQALLDLVAANYLKGQKLKPSWRTSAVGAVVFACVGVSLLLPQYAKIAYGVGGLAVSIGFLLGVDQKAIADIVLRKVEK